MVNGHRWNSGMWVVVVVMMVVAGVVRGEEVATTQPPTDHRVLVVSIDGLRPDLALRAEMPVLRGLMKTGSFTFWAYTTPVAVTLPSHVSMLTGLAVEKHGVTWNTDKPVEETGYVKVKTLFELARTAGYTTAMVAGKPKFLVLAKPETLNWCVVSGKKDEQGGDSAVAEEAVKLIKEHRPEVMFVHFPGPDWAGHSKGWGSQEQVNAIEGADVALGKVVGALKEAGVWEKTLVIVTADHGGAGKTHGAGDPRSRHIPWVATGPGVKENYDLTQRRDLNVQTEDTMVTALTFLHVVSPSDVEGHSLLQAIAAR